MKKAKILLTLAIVFPVLSLTLITLLSQLRILYIIVYVITAILIFLSIYFMNKECEKNNVGIKTVLKKLVAHISIFAVILATIAFMEFPPHNKLVGNCYYVRPDEYTMCRIYFYKDYIKLFTGYYKDSAFSPTGKSLSDEDNFIIPCEYESTNAVVIDRETFHAKFDHSYISFPLTEEISFRDTDNSYTFRKLVNSNDYFERDSIKVVRNNWEYLFDKIIETSDN